MGINIFKSVQRAFYAALGILAGCSCTRIQEPDIISFDEPVITVGASDGSTSFIIRSNTQWVLEYNADWLSLNIVKGAQGASIVADYQQNPSETESRSAEIRGITLSGGASASFTLIQMPSEPVLSLEYDELPVASEAGGYSVGITSNISQGLNYSVTYQEEDVKDWITDVELSSEELTFRTLDNTGSFNRSAIITVYGVDSFDRYVEDAVTVIQSLDMDPDAAVEKNFGYAKDLIAGQVSENIYIKGTVVADGSSPNFPDGRYTVQNTAGEAVVFESSVDLEITSGDVVSLWLLGTDLEEVKTPGGNYKLFTGVGSQHIMSSEKGSPISPRQVHINELNDDMLYSLVTLKDVEIAVPYGAYVNYNEYYITGEGGPKYENLTKNYGTCVRDINGDHIYMLTDFDVPYRRNALPKGAGSITGILVREENTNFGDMGTWQIRHLSEKDIDLAESREEGFSEVLVEWTFDMPEDLEDGQSHILPSYGPADAIFFKSNADGFYHVWDNSKKGEGQIYFGEEYRGDQPSNSSMTANTVKSAAAYSAYWDTSTYWLIRNISTEGITSSLSLQLESNSLTNTGPAEFVVEWSLDGSSWQGVDGGRYNVRGQCNSSNLHPDHIPGFKPYDFKLPDELLGRSEIYIRLRCASNVNVSGDNNIPSTATNRLGHLSLKYNK